MAQLLAGSTAGGKQILTSYNAGQYSNINAAVAAIGSTNTTLVVTNPSATAGNLTIPSNITLVVLPGGYILKSGTDTVTINGPFIAGRYLAFSGFSAGDVKFGRNYVEAIYPEWWGTGVNTIVQAAAALGTNPGKVLMGNASYSMSIGTTFANHWQGIEGAGEVISTVNFTGSGSLFTWHLGSAASIVGPFARNFSIYGTGNTNVKRAFHTVDSEEFKCENVTINDWADASHSCEGYRSEGKHMTTLDNVSWNVDLPVHLMVNPHMPGIDADLYHFKNVYFVAHSSHHFIEADGDCVITNFSVKARGSYCIGKGIITYSGGTSPSVSTNWEFDGFRLEQETDPAAFMFDIRPNLGLMGLRIINCYGGDTAQGINLDKVSNAYFNGFQYIGAHLALAVTANTNGLSWDNCFWQAGSTATLTGQYPIFHEITRTGAQLGQSAKFCNTAWPGNIESRSYHSGPTISVGNGASAEFCPVQCTGIWAIVDDGNTFALFATMGASHIAVEVSDPWGVYSITQGTGASNNIYWDAGNNRYSIENNSGVAKKYRCVCLGTNYF